MNIFIEVLSNKTLNKLHEVVLSELKRLANGDAINLQSVRTYQRDNV